MTTIVDATFLRWNHRRAFRNLAARLRVPVRIVRCDAALDVLRARIDERPNRSNDPSDADSSVLAWQLQHDELFDSSEAGVLVRISSEDPQMLQTARQQLEPLIERFAPFDSDPA